MKKISVFILSIILLLSFVPNVKALTFEKTADKFIADDNISVKETVTGDLYAAGNNITINANIDGDVIAAGNTLSLVGIVGHNVRMAGNNLTFTDVTANSMTIAGSNITLIDVIANKIYSTSSSFEFSGTTNNLNVAAKDVIIKGTINDEATITGTNVTIQEGTIINGALTVKSTNAITYEGTVVKDNITYEKTKDPDTNTNWLGNGGILYSYLYKVTSMFILALLLGLFLKSFIQKSIDNLKDKKGTSILSGLLLFIIVPVLGFLALMTILLIPVVVIVAFLYIVLLIIGTAFSSIALGELLFKDRVKNKYLQILYGVLIISLLLMLPYIGIFVWLACTGYTFGSVYLLFKKNKK